MEDCKLSIDEIQRISPTVKEVFTYLFAVYIPFTISFNGALIISFIATKQVNITISNFLIVCLCVAEGINGAVTMPLLVNHLYKEGKTDNCSLNIATQVMLGVSVSISPHITILIAVDRYIHMNPNIEKPPSKISKTFKRPWIYLLLLFCLLAAVSYGVACIFVAHLGSSAKAAWNIVMMLFYGVAMAAMITIYVRGYLRVRRFVNDRSTHASLSHEPPLYLRKLYVTVLLLVVTFCVTYIPICLVVLAGAAIAIGGTDHTPPLLYVLYFAAVLILDANGIINCLIVIHRNPKAKKWLSNKLCFYKSQPGGSDNNAIIFTNHGIEGSSIITN